jgi:hypothetical protein
MALVALKALVALVAKVAAAIKVTMIPTAVPTFPATAIERAIGRIAVASPLRAGGQ